MDDYLERQGLEFVTFLEMEGQELTALRDLSKGFNRRGIELIYFDVRSELLQPYDILPEQILHLLSENGFRVFSCRDRDLIDRRLTSIRFVRNGMKQFELCKFRPEGGALQPIF